MTSTTSTIRTTIADAATKQGLNLDGYGDVVDAVVEALTERVYEVVDLIVDRAESEGMSATEAKSFLASIGLDSRPEPEPEIEEAPAEPQTTDEKVEALTRTVSDLAGVVGQLVTLAQNKLGVTL